MTGTVPASRPAAEAKDRLIVALDVESAGRARELAQELSGAVGAFKVGMQLFTAAGPGLVRELVETGNRVFLDLKFHDIPNTVARAGIEAARLGVWMFNVHAAGGSEMMRRTADEVSEASEREGLKRPLIIGVTVLTSSGVETLREIGMNGDPEEQVVRFARLAEASGLDGVVASPRETQAIRKAIPERDLVIVTPGVRPTFATMDDQKRVMTPAEAIAAGSDHLVVGRPITGSPDVRAAAELIVAEIEGSL
ncbi:MAG TPA: orotidine-5'-phosphate decarboxylase [Pyrinomonadaceae bacterium]|nr:orotidine-5'-phosphate decarboxylase [Pyrinomonadaceae bacterium]